MQKILILIKAHDKRYANYYNNLYDKLYKIVNKYIHNFKYCDCYFLLGNPNLETLYKLENHNLWIKTDENYYNALLIKVLIGLQFFSNYDYTHIFVTNLSTFINIPELYKYCFNNYLCQSYIYHQYYKNQKFYFPSGAGYLLNKRCVMHIINYIKNTKCIENNKITKQLRDNYPQTDDLFIGYYLYKNKIKIKKMNRYDITDIRTKINNLRYSHYRIKFNKNRDNEIKIHNYLIYYIYNENSNNRDRMVWMLHM